MTSNIRYPTRPYKGNVLGKKIKKITTADEKLMSVIYQLEWIKGLQEQVDFANNPEVLSDFIIKLEIKRRLTNC
jgi:hypothetical protein